MLPETASLPAEEKQVEKTLELDAASSPVDDEPVASLKADLGPSAPSQPLVSDDPTEAELQALLQGWLDAKALTLSGQQADLSVVAREPLVKRVELERAADQAAGRSKSIDAAITTIEVVDRKPQRIALQPDQRPAPAPRVSPGAPWPQRKDQPADQTGSTPWHQAIPGAMPEARLPLGHH